MLAPPLLLLLFDVVGVLFVPLPEFTFWLPVFEPEFVKVVRTDGPDGPVGSVGAFVGFEGIDSDGGNCSVVVGG